MESFLNYYVSRSLEDSSELLGEASGQEFDARGFARRNGSGSLFRGHVSKLHGKRPSFQRCDVEKAVRDALKEVAKKKPAGPGAAKRMLAKIADSALASAKGDRKRAKRSLSCVGSVKGLSASGKDLESLVDRAGSILTANERRVLELCSKGYSVRKIGSEIGVSFPTAWRVLNSALDKVRISHGMKSRHMDKR